MQYMKVNWIHDFIDDPIWIYGELNDEMEEVRKIEIFRNGHLGYAACNGVSHIAFSSEENWPTKEEIESDPQFQVFIISQQEFEETWAKAMHQSAQN
ncbi:DUF6881 domain-containing protein [Aquirhabdus parva]|uniref:DUF6881 domain-containing protein n=1 Tax=Aquirhabdus parva TaxID=2283318 RepID=A0A345PAK3_9GAMM|nr:hypothetical protein [Aquirhabdus parva]AXI04312.1 hypothetical protein HYN46_16600 [Aquirhabdus parva]